MSLEFPQISIKDSLFSHAFSSSNWFKPSYFQWNFKEIIGDCVVLTDKNLKDASQIPPNIKKYAWLVESPVITGDCYQFAYDNYELFDVIFTHSKKLLERPNAKLLPIGGCHLDENEISLEYEKTKFVSMMYSNKNFAPGHSLRYQIASDHKGLVDIMGSGYSGVHVKKIESCKDYLFSIAIENCKEDYYFTEKLLDCFLTGTVPIYWGCPSIGDYFNVNGFYTFDNLDELFLIISDRKNLEEFYLNNVDNIIQNYQLALKYKVAEDVMWETYKTLFTAAKS